MDCVWQPSSIDLVRLKDVGGRFVADLGAPGASMCNLAINVKREPVTHKKARQAMAWCIDRARFCRTTLRGLVEPTCLMWPKHSWAYFPDLEGKIGFDVSRAHSLLKDIGLGTGFDTEIVVSSRRYPGSRDLAQMIQADAKNIGVNIKMVDLEPARYDAQVVVKGHNNMGIITYGRLNRDPGTLLTAAKAFYTDKEGTWTHFESAEYDQLRTELQSTLDREKRKGTAREIQELALEECFTNSVAYQQRAWAYASHVRGSGYDMDNAPSSPSSGWTSDLFAGARSGRPNPRSCAIEEPAGAIRNRQRPAAPCAVADEATLVGAPCEGQIAGAGLSLWGTMGRCPTSTIRSGRGRAG